MSQQITALIVDESKWLTAAMSFALLALIILLYRHRHSTISSRYRILAAMNLFFGVTIGAMAFGHLLAVTTKLATGTLRGAFPVLYLIGIAIAVPSWWLILHTRKLLAGNEPYGRTTLILNGWLGITLLALGIYNLPIAVPALFNIGYHLHSRRVVGWAILSLAVMVNTGLFVGSIIFFASGQSFEQFKGIE